MITQQAKPKVLVADDERVIADTLAIILNQSGFEATAVYNGEKAVEAARIIRPDMLISDVIMTDMNGIDAAITYPDHAAGRARSCFFPARRPLRIFSSRARSQGHEFEILAKPVHPQDLLARLRSSDRGAESKLLPRLAPPSGGAGASVLREARLLHGRYRLDDAAGTPVGANGIAALGMASCISFFTDNSSSIPSGTLQECGPRRGPGRSG